MVMVFLVGLLTGLIVAHFTHMIYRRYKIVEREPHTYEGPERRHRDRGGDDPPKYEVRR